MSTGDPYCKAHGFNPCTCRLSIKHVGLGPFDGGYWAISDSDLEELAQIIIELRKIKGAGVQAAKLNLMLERMKDVWIPGSGW